MKKFVITDAEKKLLFIVLGIVLLVCAYFFGFTKLNEQAAAIEASNKQDEAEVTRLEGMVSKQAETQAETEQFKQNIEKIIAKYPVAVPQEKAIYLVQQFEDITLMDVDSIAFSMDNTVQNFSGDNAPVGKYANLGISYSASYNSFKDFLKAMKNMFFCAPLLIMGLTLSGLVSWFGFGTGFLLERNYYIVGVFYTHLFLLAAVFAAFHGGNIIAKIRRSKSKKSSGEKSSGKKSAN